MALVIFQPRGTQQLWPTWCHLRSHCAQVPPVSAVRQLHEAILLSFATTLGKASRFEPIWETFGDHPPQWHWKWRIQQNHLKPPASKATARSNFSFIRYQAAASPIINKDATISSPRARNGLRSRSSWGSAFFWGGSLPNCNSKCDKYW